MKAVNIREAQPRLRELIAEACEGELIVLTDGEKQVALEPHIPLDIERDSPELEAELLSRACDGRSITIASGHNVQEEAPVELAAAIADFIG